jgi:hypothetical protein
MEVEFDHFVSAGAVGGVADCKGVSARKVCEDTEVGEGLIVLLYNREAESKFSVESKKFARGSLSLK